jgi:hypothetical protein
MIDEAKRDGVKIVLYLEVTSYENAGMIAIYPTINSPRISPI